MQELDAVLLGRDRVGLGAAWTTVEPARAPARSRPARARRRAATPRTMTADSWVRVPRRSKAPRGSLALDRPRTGRGRCRRAATRNWTLPLRAPVVDPAAELDLLADVAAEVGDADGADGGGSAPRAPLERRTPPAGREGREWTSSSWKEADNRDERGVAADPVTQRTLSAGGEACQGKASMESNVSSDSTPRDGAALAGPCCCCGRAPPRSRAAPAPAGGRRATAPLRAPVVDSAERPDRRPGLARLEAGRGSSRAPPRRHARLPPRARSAQARRPRDGRPPVARRRGTRPDLPRAPADARRALPGERPGPGADRDRAHRRAGAHAVPPAALASRATPCSTG